MRRASDGAAVAIEIDVAIALTPYPTRLLGEPFHFLHLEGMLGTAWTPFGLIGERGCVRVDGHEIALEGICGVCERGQLTNLRSPAFAIKYDYVAVVCPGDDGYGLIDFTSHALHR